MSDENEFDPNRAAARAVGDLADEPAADPSPPDRSGADNVDAGDVDDTGREGGGLSIKSALTSLVTAPERGPTAENFQRYDVDPGMSLIVDGVTDYVLDLAGADVDSGQLGPAGKVALGISRLSPGESSDASDEPKTESDPMVGGEAV